MVALNVHRIDEDELIQVIIIAPGITARAGLRSLLSEDPEISVIGEAADLLQADSRLQEADVVVWLPGSSTDIGSLLEDPQKQSSIETKAILLIDDEPAMLEKLLRLPQKVWGFLSSEASQSELTAAVQALNEGLSVIHPQLINQISKTSNNRNDGDGKNIEELTSREVEILELLALGLTNKQIALRLKISTHTVKFHVSTIFSKLGTTNRVETVNLGLKKGIIVL